MESIFDKFNQQVELMASAVAEASSPEEAEKIQFEFDAKIDAAEKELQDAIEQQFKEEQEAIQAEEKAFLDEIKTQEEEDKKKQEEEDKMDEEDEEDEQEEDIEEIRKMLIKNYTKPQHSEVLKGAGIEYSSRDSEAILVDLRIKHKLY